jgi:hypothetical protein
MLTDSRFWFGVVAGLVALYAWHAYQMRKGGKPQ